MSAIISSQSGSASIIVGSTTAAIMKAPMVRGTIIAKTTLAFRVLLTDINYYIDTRRLVSKRDLYKKKVLTRLVKTYIG